MKRITKSTQIEKAIHSLRLDEYFDIKDLQFEIFSYEKGEQMVSPLEPLKYFMFIIEGMVRIYTLKEDSSIQAIVNLDEGAILGHHEFCFESDEYTLYAEAITSVKCLVLPFKQAYKNLKKDSDFLMFLLKNTLLDQVRSSEIMQRKTNLEDQILFYIQNICENNTLSSVNNAVEMLHCSRRSLQRALKKLCDQGVLVHEKHGYYHY